jgi:AcrR family transcriptional regulator
MEKDKKIEMLIAAERLIAEKGFYNTKVEEITKEAGVAKGTFYLYFKTKEDIFKEVFKHRAEEYKIKILPVYELNGSSRDILLEMTKRYLRFSIENRNFFLLILRIIESERELAEKLKEEYHCEKRRMDESLEEIFKTAAANGEIKEEYAGCEAKIANIYNFLINGHIHKVLFKNKCGNILEMNENVTIDTDREAEFIVQILFEGIKK